jgi:hypothetical protein
MLEHAGACWNMLEQGWFLGFGGTPQNFCFWGGVPKKAQILGFWVLENKYHENTFQLPFLTWHVVFVLMTAGFCFSFMASFKKFYKAVEKNAIPDLPASWKGQLYRCTLQNDAVLDGVATKVACDHIVKCTNFATSGLRSHCRDCHPKEFSLVEGTVDAQGSSQKDIRLFSSKDLVDRQQREKVVMAFAHNALPFRLVEDEAFKSAFGAQIPRGLGRQELASATALLKENTLAQLVRRCVHCWCFLLHKTFIPCRLKGKNVFLMVDGGTLTRKRHFNASIGCDGRSYFWKSVRVDSLTTAEVLKQLEIIVADLAKQDIFVFCIVADNAKAFQKAAGAIAKLMFGILCFPSKTDVFERIGAEHCGEEKESQDDSLGAGFDEDDSEESLPIEAESALSQMKSKGIFTVRCAAHSLQVCPGGGGAFIPFFSNQLLMKDFQKQIPIVSLAVEGIEALLLQHASTPERTAKFINAQIALGREPKVLKRSGTTRCEDVSLMHAFCVISS